MFEKFKLNLKCSKSSKILSNYQEIYENSKNNKIFQIHLNLMKFEKFKLI